MSRLRHWWPLIGLLILAFNLRPVAVSIGPVLSEISSDIGLTGFTAGLLTSLPSLSFSIFGALAASLANRIGPHRTIAIALVALVLGQFGRLLSDSPLPFLAMSVLALAGMAQANVLLPTLVRLHYPNRVGMATALYSLSLTIGVTVASAATAPLAQSLGGWRGALSLYLVTACAALIAWLPLLIARPASSFGKATKISLARISRTKLGWAMAVFFGIQSAQAYSIFGWLPSVFRTAGMDGVSAGLMLGIATGVGIVPAFLIPAYVARAKNPRALFLVIIGFLVVGYLGLLIAPLAASWFWSLCLALGTSSFPLILALFGTRARTPAATAALSGFAQSVGYSIAAIGPISFGMLYSLSNSWGPSIWLQLGLTVPMTIAGLYACRPILIEDELAQV